MKKLFCFTLTIFILFSCLTACTFSQSMSGALAGDAESTPKVEKMMTALAENRISDAKNLMHPQATENSDTAIAQMVAYLSGRKADSIELISINVKTSTGPSGKTRQERVGYQVTLSDGDVIYLNTSYVSTNAGTGFASFQLVLGVV